MPGTPSRAARAGQALSLLLGIAGAFLPAAPVHAQISPECSGVKVPADYSEQAQQSFLQNYFAATFLMTPLAPPVVAAGPRGSAGLELGGIPPLPCERRLVLEGTKTEETNRSPVNPRLRIRAQLPPVGPVSSHLGFAFLPPVPSPVGTLLQVAGEVGAGWLSEGGLSIGARGHLTVARMRADIATAFVEGDPAVDDLFFANTMGLDLAVGQAVDVGVPWLALTPWASAGIADVSTLFIAGDDFAVVQNVTTPWSGALVAVGLQALFVEHVEVGLEASWAIPIFPTVKLKAGVAW